MLDFDYQGRSIVDAMQKEEERRGMMNQPAKPMQQIVEDSLQECNLGNHQIKDIREDCFCWEIHISGVLTGEERRKLIERISQKANHPADLIKIIAFYY